MKVSHQVDFSDVSSFSQLFSKKAKHNLSLHHHHISGKGGHQNWMQHFPILVALYALPLTDNPISVPFNLHLFKIEVSLFSTDSCRYLLEDKLCPPISTTTSINALLTHAEVISGPRNFA